MGELHDGKNIWSKISWGLGFICSNILLSCYVVKDLLKILQNILHF